MTFFDKPLEYRENIRWDASSMYYDVITERMKQGAAPKMPELATLFGQCIKAAQVKEDLISAMGLQEKADEKADEKKDRTEDRTEDRKEDTNEFGAISGN